MPIKLSFLHFVGLKKLLRTSVIYRGNAGRHVSLTPSSLSRSVRCVYSDFGKHDVVSGLVSDVVVTKPL